MGVTGCWGLRESVEKRTCELVLEAYAFLEAAIRDSANGFPDPAAILTKSTEQVSCPRSSTQTWPVHWGYFEVRGLLV